MANVDILVLAGLGAAGLGLKVSTKKHTLV